MATAAAPALCTVCGARRAGSPCAQCAMRAGPWIATGCSWRERVAPARPAESLLGALVDGALWVAAALVGLLCGRAAGLNALGAIVLAVGAGLAAAVATVAALTRTGQTPGLALAKVRVLGADSGYPPRWADLLRPTTRASTTRGPDPLGPPPRLARSGPAATPVRPTARAAAAVPGGWSVLQPGRASVPVGRRAVVGRSSSVGLLEPGTTRVDVYDLTRTVSRNHLVLEPDPTSGTLWVTDLGSTNGSRLQLDGPHASRPLPPRQRIAVASGSVIFCGDQPIVVVTEGTAR